MSQLHANVQSPLGGFGRSADGARGRTALRGLVMFAGFDRNTGYYPGLPLGSEPFLNVPNEGIVGTKCLWFAFHDTAIGLSVDVLTLLATFTIPGMTLGFSVFSHTVQAGETIYDYSFPPSTILFFYEALPEYQGAAGHGPWTDYSKLSGPVLVDSGSGGPGQACVSTGYPVVNDQRSVYVKAVALSEPGGVGFSGFAQLDQTQIIYAAGTVETLGVSPGDQPPDLRSSIDPTAYWVYATYRFLGGSQT